MDNLGNLLQKMYDMNSKFPETQKFLARKGLTNVNQLDEKGMIELQNHLKMLAEEFKV